VEMIMKLNRSFWICLIVLLAVLGGIQFAGHRALARDYVRLDVHDELNYLKSAQADYMQIHEAGVFGYLWETLHSFKTKNMLAKEPGTRLASAPLILLNKGVNPEVLRHYAFLWIIPAALLLYFGLTLLIRPLPALAGALLFVLSNCTLGTFLHWYQEMTTIPAICALILIICYESRYGNRDDWGWLFTGAVIGAGFLTKISFVFIALWVCGVFFLMSGWLDNPRVRRMRLFKAALLAYIPASFWWPAHFPYVLRYASGPSFMMHGTLERGWEHVAMFVRTQFSYMYGFWISLLLLATASAALLWFIQRIRRKQIRLDPAVILSCVLIVPLGMIYIKKRYGSVAALLPLALAGGLLLIRRKRGEKGVRFSPAVAVFTALVVPLAILYLRRFLGNSLNPRPYSVFIPLAAAAFALALDRIIRQRRAGFPVVFGILLLQGVSIFNPALRPDWKQDKRWVQPFHQTPVNPTDYSWLPTVAPLPQGQILKIGYAGDSLTFSPHAVAWGYYPDVSRVELVDLLSLSRRDYSEPLPDIAEVLENARMVDYIVIALFRDFREFEDRIGRLEGLFHEKLNAMNEDLVEAFRQDAGFEGPEMLIAEPGKGPDLAVFRRIALEQ